MRTSQIIGVFQKKTFKMNFFDLNVSTRLLKIHQKVFPEKKPREVIDLNLNKIIKVMPLKNKLKENYSFDSKKVGIETITLPHDFKFPFALFYH